MVSNAQMAKSVATTQVPDVAGEPSSAPAFSAFAPGKAAWKDLPGNRYSVVELQTMEARWNDLEIISPPEQVFDAD
jgi:hypothetical protein